MLKAFKESIKIYSVKHKKKIPLVLKTPLFSSWYTWLVFLDFSLASKFHIFDSFSGPTVYDTAHIGHASTYVRLDIVQRILRSYFNVNLVTCMNITNIDDKIIKRGNETGRSWKLIVEEYEAEFWEDLQSLNVKQPDIKLRVTDKIPEIIKFIEQIESKGLTRKSGDGSVYFKTAQYLNYGKLQHVVLDNSQSADFALWKGAKPDEPSFESPWGRGRPGWHIECSTLASLVFGSHLDFHAGGRDLCFPHHENEEAQSCVYHAVDDWVTNWIHTGHLHMKGHSEKMSKSLKNTVTIRELLKDHSSDQFRVACLLSHYRSSIEFGPDLMTAADAVLKKLSSFRDDSRSFVLGLKGCGDFNEQELMKAFEKTQREVEESLSDDFNTARPIGSIMELMSTVSRMINARPTETRSEGCEKTVVQGIVKFIDSLFATFGVGEEKQGSSTDGSVQTENMVNTMVRMRNEIRLKAKAEKNKSLFHVSDLIRDALKENNVILKDHGNESSWSNKN